MTTDFEKRAREIIEAWCSRSTHTLPEIWDVGDALADLAERLLKENSELRVRDSNVTAHSLNVMAINEDLQQRKCGRCKHRRADGYCDRIEKEPWDEGIACLCGEYGFEASIRVSPNFGCVLWEKKL